MDERRSVEMGDVLLYLWRLSRPETWLVSIVPMYVGFLLASRTIVPGFDAWARFWADAAASGATSAQFFGALAAWWGAGWRFVVASVVMGPLAWAATLLINDVHDLEADKRNPRKARSPLVQGLVTRGWAHASAYVFAALALAAAALVGPAFALLVAASLAFAWAYSAPPLRLKTRPGADVLVNAIGVGAVSALAGWVLARPLAEAPWLFLPQGLLVAAAVYIPTTLVDHDADRAMGFDTFATRLGPRRAYAIGFACWIAANVGALALASQDVVLPRAMLPLLAIFCPLLVYEYHAFIGKAPDEKERVKGIVLCALTFAAVNAVFALLYTGLWRT